MTVCLVQEGKAAATRRASIDRKVQEVHRAAKKEGPMVGHKSIERLCNVDQFCRNISSIIVFSGLPRLERWVAPAVVELGSPT